MHFSRFISTIFALIALSLAALVNASGQTMAEVDPRIKQAAKNSLVKQLKQDQALTIALEDMRYANQHLALFEMEGKGGIDDKEGMRRFFQEVLQSLPNISRVIVRDDINTLFKVIGEEVQIQAEVGGQVDMTEVGQIGIVVNASFGWTDYTLLGHIQAQLLCTALGDTGRITTIEIDRWALTRAGEYTAIALAGLLALLVGYALMQLQRLLANIRYASAHAQPAEGLVAISQAPGYLKNLAKVKLAKTHFEKDQRQADALFASVKTAVEDERFDDAAALLENLQKIDRQHARGNEYLQRLPAIKSAANLVKQARAASDIGQARALFAEAMQLNPDLTDAITAELALPSGQSTSAITPMTPGGAVVSTQLVTNRVRYEQMAEIDKGLNALAEGSPKRANLLHKRELLAQEIQLTGDFSIQGPWGEIFATRRTSINIGRASSAETAAITVQHQRVSRPSKQTELTYQNGRYWLRDLGSTNGSMLNGQLLVAHNAQALASGDNTLAMGGTISPPKRGSCRYNVQVNRASPASLFIAVDPLLKHNSGEIPGAQDWLSFDIDANRYTLMFNGPVVVTNDHGLPVAPNLAAASGLVTLTPTAHGVLAQAAKGGPLHINGHEFWLPTPVAAGVSLAVNGTSLSICKG